MTYRVTDAERAWIKVKADAFWADFKIMTYGRAVIFYVDSYRDDFDYPDIVGYYDNPDEVMQAMMQTSEYANRSTVSCRDMRDLYGEGFGRQDLQVEAARLVAKYPEVIE